MITMIINYKFATKKETECYTMETSEVETIIDLTKLVNEFMNEDVYSIILLIDGEVISITYGNK